MIINHLGCPTLDDLTDPKKAKVFWDGMKKLADCPNTYMKLSMLCYTDENWDENPVVVDAFHNVIELFGIDRCFFCSNYPPDLEMGWPIDRLLNAFDKISS